MKSTARLVGASLCALALVVLASPLVAAQSSTAEGRLQVFWQHAYDALGDDVVGLRLIVSDAEACTLPDNVVGPVDRGRGIRIGLGGVTFYETGTAPIVTEFGRVLSTIFLSFFAPDGFQLFSEVPFELAGTQPITVECRDEGGVWTPIGETTVDVPRLEQLPPFSVGIERQADQLVIRQRLPLDGTIETPDAADLDVELDGVTIVVARDDRDAEPMWTGPLPEELPSGVHVIDLRWRDETYAFALLDGFDQSVTPLATTSPTTVVPTSVESTEPLPATTTVGTSSDDGGEGLGPGGTAAVLFAAFATASLAAWAGLRWRSGRNNTEIAT